MPALKNPRHERFAQSVAASNGENASAAYLAEYPDSKPPSARANAARLLASDTIRARVAELLDEGNKRLQITADDIAREAWKIAQGSRVDVARVSALTLLSKRHAEFNPKFEVEHSGNVTVTRNTRGLRGS